MPNCQHSAAILDHLSGLGKKLALTAAAGLFLATGAAAQSIVVNEFYRAGTFATDEWLEVVLLQNLTAAQLETYHVGDSTSSTASKFGAYRFTNMALIASSFPAGTIIVVSGSSGPAADTSYDPGGGDWNLNLRIGSTNITTVGSGDFASLDVAWVDTAASGATIAPNGFCVNYHGTPGAFGQVCQVTITAPGNNTGSRLTGSVLSASTPGNWTSSVALASLSPGLGNGGTNDSSINTLRSGGTTAPPNITYTPSPGSINFPAGLNGVTVNTGIQASPSGGSGTGSAATTTINSCAITGAGAGAFGATTGQPLSFIGNTTSSQNLGLSCTIAASTASASLSCSETQGAGAPVARTWSLNCPAATPDVAPTVTSTVPLNGATGVVASSNLTLNFSEPVSTASGWFGLSCSTSGTVSYVESGTGSTRSIDPGVNLAAGETCTGSVESTLVSDLDGAVDFMSSDFSFSFTVAAGGGGTTAVFFTAPAANQNPVRVNADVTVIFNQSVAVTPSWFSINCSLSGAHPGSFSTDAVTTTRYRIDPSTDFVLGDVCTVTVLSAAITPALSAGNFSYSFTVGNYYAAVNASSNATLRSTLHPVIDGHTQLSYTPGAWNALEIADGAPDNYSQIIDVYRNRRFTKVSDRAGTGSGITYNREHTWPNSLGFSSNAPGPYTDTHMLYLSDTVYNSDRGNLPYRNCPNTGGSPCGERSTQNNLFYPGGTGSNQGIYPGTSNWVNSSQFEAWNTRKGDLARAVLYMDVRYEGTSGEINLEMGETTLTSGRMASLSTLIAWHNGDPPDAAERLRNDIIFAFQNNRNPYIDNPSWVNCIYNNTDCDAAATPPTLAFNPSASSTINLSGGSGIGSTANGSIVVTPSGGTGTGSAATTTLSSCSITGSGFSTVTPGTSSYVGSSTTQQTLSFSCTVAAGVQNGTLSCQETLGLGAATPRSWPLACPAAVSSTPPTLSYSPATGSSLTLTGGSAVGSVAGTSIAISPSGGSGSGSGATSTVNSCSITGAGAAAFGSVLNLSLSFVGNTTSNQSLPLQCTRAASAASATLSCQQRLGSAAATTISYALTCPAAAAGADLISLTQTGVPYSQNFDTLQSGSFVSAMPAGWRFSETGTGADSTYRSSSGSDNAGDTYAYGPGACERALGTLLTTSVNSRIGACFVNNTGRAINTLRMSYTGEQWRRGAATGSDVLEFQYLINPSAPGVGDTAGTWIDANALDFTNPVTVGTANSSVNGSDAANRAARNTDLGSLSIPAGQNFCIRWLDTDLAAGSDHGLAVDDFSLTPDPGAAPGACTGLCVADASITEGNSGNTNMVFNVSLSSPAPVGGVQFDARTSVETASNFDQDYVLLEQNNISIAAGSNSATVTVQVIGDSKPEATEIFRLALSNVRGSSVGDAVGVGTIVTDDAFELWQVQTTGDRTPLDGLNIRTRQNVVTAVKRDGFFMQTPAVRSDQNPLSSDAVFVFTGSTPAVVAGNLIDVTGNVQERFCSTQISATGAGNSFTVTGTTTPITPVEFNANRPSPNLGSLSCGTHPDPETANFECFEHMLVRIQDGVVQGGSQRFPGTFSPPAIPSAVPSDPAAEPLIVAGGNRVFRGPGFSYPGFNASLGYPDYNAGDLGQAARVAEVPIWGGAPNVFELDPDALDITANRVFVGGERFTATGVLAYEFDDFEFWPTALSVTNTPSYPRAPAAQAADELSIGSLNLLRFYGAGGTNITTPLRCDGSTGSYNSYSTGATGVAEVTRRRNKLARYVIDVMKAPDVLGVQEAETLAGLQALAAEINARNASLGYSAYLVPGNDRSGISPGYLIRDGGAIPRVTGVVVTQLAFNERLSVDNGCLHDRPPLRLRASFGATAFTVINNHTRSLIGIDEPNSDGARTRQKRLEQSLSIRALVSADMAAEPGRPIVVIGDQNAFQFSDGWVDTIGVIRGIQRPAFLASPAALPLAQQLVNAVDLIDPNERYSYLFDNAAQVLDHALLNSAAQSIYRGLTFVRNNVDAPPHSYGLAENACSGIDIQPGTGTTNAAFGAAACTEGLSDHEGFILRLAGRSTPMLSIPASLQAAEGNSLNSLSVPVTLSSFPAGLSQIRVPYRVTGGSALQGLDFNPGGGGAFVLFSSPALTANLLIDVLGDTLAEADETIELELGQAIDPATGQPASVSLSPGAQRLVITLSNDDGALSVVPVRIGSADRGATGGDFVSQQAANSARAFRYLIEVPANVDQLSVEIFDADFGAGGAGDANDVPAGANFDSGSEVSYRLLNPSGAQAAALVGNTTGPVDANGSWLALPVIDAPSAGRYVLEVRIPSGTLDSNGYRMRARALPFARGGGASTDLNVYAESFASLGHPASGLVGTSSETFYPFVTEGCAVRTRSFDFDSETTTQSSIAINAPHGFSQLFGDAQLSTDGQWNTLDSNAFTSINHAQGYGIWSASISIEGGGGSANQGTVYFAAPRADGGNTAPSSNPPNASFRLYQASNGAAPRKPSMRQQLFHVSGANPPSPGNPGTYRVSVQIRNQSEAAIEFAAPDQIVRSLVPFGGAVSYQGGAQPNQGSVLSEPDLAQAGTITWNPGIVPAGGTAELTYMITVSPSIAGITTVTGSAADQSGTQARYLDETRSATQFGPLCELSINSAGTAVPTPVTLAAMRSERLAAQVKINFSVATQVGVAAYRIHAGNGDFRTPVGAMLAAKGDSLTPISMETSVPLSSSSFYLEVLDVDGSNQWFGPFAVGANQGSLPDLPAIDWASLRLEAAASASRRNQVLSAVSDRVRLRVTQTGPVRVSAEQLLQLAPGLQGAALNQLELRDGDGLVAVQLDSQDAFFNAGDTLWFWGRALERDDLSSSSAWLYGKARTYSLRKGQGLLMQVSTLPFAGNTLNSYRRREWLDQQSIYQFSSPAADPFASHRLFANPQTPARQSYRFALRDALSGPVQIAVEVWGGSDLPGIDDHWVKLMRGSAELASKRFDGVQASSLSVTLAQTIAPLDIEVLVPGSHGPSFDLVLVDRLRADYRSTIVAEQGLWQAELSQLRGDLDRIFASRMGDALGADAVQQFALRGMASASSVRAWLIEPERALLLSERRIGDTREFALPENASNSARLMVFDSAQSAPASVLPWLAENELLEGKSELLVLSHPQFLDALAPFVSARRAQGMSVKWVNVEAVYQRFGHGEPEPTAIREYLRLAAQSMQTRYVLLVGGDTYDPRDYLGAGSLSFLPTPYRSLHPLVRFGASDAWYTDLNDDGAPDLALGRWPVRSVSELNQVIAKTLRPPTNTRALLLADDLDAADAFSFAGASDRVAELLAASSTSKGYLDQISPAQARSLLLERVAANDRLIHYFGHSGPTTWSYPAPGILSPSEIFAGALSNSEPNILVQWGCWNSYHVIPQYNTLAHAWLLSARGAAAVIGAASITDASNDALLAELLAAQLRTAPDLGTALLRAKRAMHARRPGAVDVLYGTTLLGDPTLPLR